MTKPMGNKGWGTSNVDQRQSEPRERRRATVTKPTGNQGWGAKGSRLLRGGAMNLFFRVKARSPYASFNRGFFFYRGGNVLMHRDAKELRVKAQPPRHKRQRNRKLPCFGKPKPNGKINMRQIHGKPIKWGRRLTTEAASKGGGKGEDKSRANL